jgi:imidazolonepropionase
MNILFENIRAIILASDSLKEPRRGTEMSDLNLLNDAYLFVENDRISDYGSMKSLQQDTFAADKVIDLKGAYVLPVYIDSHTHIVFPSSREQEFEMKIRGASYEEIAAHGGGILNSAAKLKNTSETALIESAARRIDEVIRMGTGAIEIKSGYGLSVKGELKMLRVIKKLKEISPVPIKATFLGAHAVPREYKHKKEAYIELIINEMLPNIASEKLADYIDVFIEKGFYSLEDGRKIIEAGMKYGLKAKIHVDQMHALGGVEMGVALSALSLDHLENIEDSGIHALKNSSAIPVLLPSCSFYLNMKYPPARKLIEAGLPVCIASDYNPGSSPSGNLNFSLSLACIKMKMTPEEAINALTCNAAFALELQDSYGTISRGKMASFIISKAIPSLAYMPYSFGNHSVEKVIIHGKEYQGFM